MEQISADGVRIGVWCSSVLLELLNVLEAASVIDAVFMRKSISRWVTDGMMGDEAIFVDGGQS